MEDDEVVKEIDVYLTKELKESLWLMQYPVRPADCSYEDEHFISTKLKPQQKKVNIELAIDTSSSSYMSSKGEHIAMSVDGPLPKGPPAYASGKLDKIDLVSAQSSQTYDRYAIAAIKNGQCHLTPISTIVQMRPDLGFLDQADSASKARAQLLELEGESSQDEEEEVKAVTVKFARQETSEQKSRRMKSFDYLTKKQSEERWVPCTYQKIQSDLSGMVRHRLLATNHESVEAYSSAKEYLSKLIPKPENDIIDNPDMPSNVLSLAQLKNMSLNDQVRAIVTNAKVIKWSQLLALLDTDVNQPSVMKAVQQVAVLVQGCWVIKSEVLHPKDSFSAHNSSPAEVICRARDFVLWKFTSSRSLIRKDVAHIVKIPSEEMKEMLEQVAKPKAKQGWIFNFEFDQEFVDRHKEVVERQQMLWDAKYLQLAKHFKLPKDQKLGGRRRRTSSRSKSRSDVSDGEKTPVDVKEEFTFESPAAHHSTSNGDTSSTANLMSELASLLREKLLVQSIFTLTDMKRIYQTKLAQCPQGHVLGSTGVSDNLLEKSVLSVGATKINLMNPPGTNSIFYALSSAGDDLDPYRQVIIDLLINEKRIKNVQLLKAECDTRGITGNMTEDKLKELLKNQKDALLAQAQEKRQKRERLRLEIESSRKIQSAYRSHRSRNQVFGQVRDEFSQLLDSFKSRAPTVNDVGNLFTKINFFYQIEKDIPRMISFCALAVKHHSVFKQYTTSTEIVCQVQTQTWLKTVSRILLKLCGTNENISMPLRVLEIFLDDQLYNESEEKLKMLCRLYRDIITDGYFVTLRQLVDSRIPECEEMTTSPPSAPPPPTPFSASLLVLLLRPLKLTADQDSHFRTTVLREFCENFMNRAYTSQVYHYILPCVRLEPSLPISDIVTAMRNPSENTSQRGDNPTLLHSFMTLVSPHIKNLSEGMTSQYLRVITELFPSLSTDSVLRLGDDDDDDDDFEMQYDINDDTVLSLSQMKHDCIQIINMPIHVMKFKALTRTAKAKENILLIAKLCHVMTSKLGQYVHPNRLLYSLAFDKDFLRQLWNECLTISVINSAGNEVTVMQVLARGLGESLYTTVEGSIHSLMALLSAFSSLFYHSILTLHDDDFRPRPNHQQAGDDVVESSCPFTRQQLIPMVATLRDACLGIVYLAIPDSKPVFDEKRQFLEEIGIKTDKEKIMSKEEYIKQRTQWISLFNVTARLTKHIYIRDTRTRFCPDKHWLSNQVRVKATELKTIYNNHIEVYDNRPLRPGLGEEEEGTVNLSVTDSRRLVVLTELPFVVPFEERVRIFHNLLAADRQNYQTGFDGYGPMSNSAIELSIRRDYIYEDAFEKLSPENEVTVKPKVRVHMRNAVGLDEAGIDGGGIFREFLWELLRTGFDPNRGLFRYTASDDKMFYPNPEAPSVMGDDFKKHFFFLGRMLGKALYENMLIELPFAGFFLSKILGKVDSDFHQLASLDPQLYKNLLFVKNYKGDVTELGLDFSVMNEILGETFHLELKPNGKNIVVNNDNCIEYVHLMADYKLNKQIRPQCQAFTQGLEDVLRLEWLRMFNHHELHILISGATSPINVDDLRQHTLYSGGYAAEHGVIASFWKVVNDFTAAQRSALLKFVTSCSRPPLLGFKDLYPAFCIHHGGQEDRLPTASTCMNFLKLPEYKDEETLRTKLLYAIESGAGFELS